MNGGADSVFDEFPEFIVNAEYSAVDRTNVLGASAGAAAPVSIIIDEGTNTRFAGQTVDTRSDDVLIYARRDTAPLNSRSCIGGFLRTLDTLDPRTFRIEDWNVAGYTRGDGHIELTATEVAA